MHDKELHNFYSQSNIKVNKLREMKLSGEVTFMVEIRNTYVILIGKPEGKRSFRGHMEDNIKIHIKGIGCGGCGLDSSVSEKDSATENLTGCATVSFSRTLHHGSR
jgi:hypothetical protein